MTVGPGTQEGRVNGGRMDILAVASIAIGKKSTNIAHFLGSGLGLRADDL